MTALPEHIEVYLNACWTCRPEENIRYPHGTGIRGDSQPPCGCSQQVFFTAEAALKRHNCFIEDPFQSEYLI